MSDSNTTTRVHRLADLTWEDVQRLEAPVVAILPIGATEAHGPHLPLGTDVIIAEAMAEAGGARLADERITSVILPAVAYTAAPFAAGFPGTVSTPVDAVAGVIVAAAEGAERAGSRVLAIANAHLDPTHVDCLRDAVAVVSAARRIAVAFPDVTRRRFAERLTEEFLSGACHAGRYETSLVLAARPDLVRSEIAAALDPNPASLVDAIDAGLRTFEAAGGPRAYFGWPAEASAEEGRRTIEILGEMLAESVRGVLA